MPREPRFRWHRFLSDDTCNRVNLVLCDYPTARILAIRGIDIRPDTMRKIKDACDHQLEFERCEQDIYRVVRTFHEEWTAAKMIRHVEMIPASD